jgi:hypothetical protein
MSANAAPTIDGQPCSDTKDARPVVVWKPSDGCGGARSLPGD